MTDPNVAVLFDAVAISASLADGNRNGTAHQSTEQYGENDASHLSSYSVSYGTSLPVSIIFANRLARFGLSSRAHFD